MLLKKLFLLLCVRKADQGSSVRQSRDVAEIEATSLKQIFILLSYAMNFIDIETQTHFFRAAFLRL